MKLENFAFVKLQEFFVFAQSIDSLFLKQQ